MLADTCFFWCISEYLLNVKQCIIYSCQGSPCPARDPLCVENARIKVQPICMKRNESDKDDSSFYAKFLGYRIFLFLKLLKAGHL